MGRPEFDSEHFRIFDFLMHRKRIRRIRFPQDPNPELEKHPMSLEASQSSRESTRYPRDSKPIPGGFPPPGLGFMSLAEWIFSRRLRGFEAHRMLFELRIWILWKANASNLFLVDQKIENPKMLRMKF